MGIGDQHSGFEVSRGRGSAGMPRVGGLESLNPATLEPSVCEADRLTRRPVTPTCIGSDVRMPTG
jgi:hypothetical protein